ncbi:MAG: beta-lactamase family protein [Blastocatellia bacterium]|nr:beta-lactamase family protein [Blastocatellia bacterium]
MNFPANLFNLLRLRASIGRYVFCLTLALALCAVGLAPEKIVFSASNDPQSQTNKAADGQPRNHTEQGLAGYAKVLCSAVFVSGRDSEEARRNSGYFFLPQADQNAPLDMVVDRKQKLVRLTLRGSITRTAKYFGDQGCVILQPGSDKIFFKPVTVKTRLPDPMTQPWPMGDLLPKKSLPPEIDEARLNKAVDLAVSDPEALTAAFIVVYKGQIIAERYGPGIDKETQLESWSMGKSITATLVGILIKNGHFKLNDRAPVAEWQEPGDPRSAITIADLLRMSGGLRFSGQRDPGGFPDHFYIYTGAIDAFKFSYTRPQEFPPNTEGRYLNCDPLTLGHIVKETVRKRGEEYLTFPQRALFDPIGIRRMVLETDPYGNFLLTGYDYGTGRNWARLGLLYLWDGVWQGKRMLPEGFAKFVSTPAPAWSRPTYGGLFWLNRTREWNLPEDAYFMAGAGGQRTFIIPSLDMVVVRLGHFRGDRRGMRALNEAFKELTAAIKQ